VVVRVRAEREFWSEKREVSIVGRREVGRDEFWCRVAMQAERVVLVISFVRHGIECESLQDITRNFIRRFVEVLKTVRKDQIRSQDRRFLPGLSQLRSFPVPSQLTKVKQH
jgi:hypothetical protein